MNHGSSFSAKRGCVRRFWISPAPASCVRGWSHGAPTPTGTDNHRPSAGSPPGTPLWSRGNTTTRRGASRKCSTRRNRTKFFLHWYWRMNAELGLSNVWLAAGNLRKARLEAERFLAVRLVDRRAQPAGAGLGGGGTSRDGREGLEGGGGEASRRASRFCRGLRFPRRRGAFMPPAPICTDRQRMKPPRKPSGRAPKRSSSPSRTRSRPTTRCATHSSPRHRFAGFGVSEAGTKAGGNAGVRDESTLPWCRRG